MRIFAILLMVLVIWYAVDRLGEGMGEGASGVAQTEETRGARPDAARAGRPAPITDRVRERVDAAMELGERRRAGVR